MTTETKEAPISATDLLESRLRAAGERLGREVLTLLANEETEPVLAEAVRTLKLPHAAHLLTTAASTISRLQAELNVERMLAEAKPHA